MPVSIVQLSLEIPGNPFLDADSNSQLTSLSLAKFSLYKGLATFCLCLSKIFCESLPVFLWDPSPTFLWLIYSSISFLIIFNSSHFPVLLTKRTLPPTWTNPLSYSSFQLVSPCVLTIHHYLLFRRQSSCWPILYCLHIVRSVQKYISVIVTIQSIL